MPPDAQAAVFETAQGPVSKQKGVVGLDAKSGDRHIDAVAHCDCGRSQAAVVVNRLPSEARAADDFHAQPFHEPASRAQLALVWTSAR